MEISQKHFAPHANETFVTLSASNMSRNLSIPVSICQKACSFMKFSPMHLFDQLLLAGLTWIGVSVTVAAIVLILVVQLFISHDQKSRGKTTLLWFYLAFAFRLSTAVAFRSGGYTAWVLLSFLDLISSRRPRALSPTLPYGKSRRAGIASWSLGVKNDGKGKWKQKSWRSILNEARRNRGSEQISTACLLLGHANVMGYPSFPRSWSPVL